MKKARPNLNTIPYFTETGLERRMNCKPIRITNAELPLCEVSFRHIKHALISRISENDCIFVCCYSISDFDVLDALCRAKGVSIITDAVQWDTIEENRKADLLERLEQAPRCTALIADLNDKNINFGFSHSKLSKNPRFGVPFEPAMHNKFIVFCDVDFATENVPLFNPELGGPSTEITESFLLPRSIWI